MWVIIEKKQFDADKHSAGHPSKHMILMMLYDRACWHKTNIISGTWHQYMWSKSSPSYGKLPYRKWWIRDLECVSQPLLLCIHEIKNEVAYQAKSIFPLSTFDIYFTHLCSTSALGFSFPTQRSQRPALFLSTSFLKNIAPQLAVNVVALAVIRHWTNWWVRKY